MAMTLVELEAFSETKPEKRFLTEEIIKYLVANPGAALPGNVTLQGNTFNGNSELVQTESDGKLPAIDGSQLTNLPSGGVAGVTGNLVDNTDPANPVVDLPAILPAVDGSQLTNLPGGGLGYSVYTVLLSQTGTDAPTAIILQNTLSEVPVLGRGSAGDYSITTTGLFTSNKTFISPRRDYDFLNASFVSVNYQDANTIGIQTGDGGGPGDGFLPGNFPLEIRVYP